ncbi:DUF6638 family protein [Parasulfitobacter algicola]|uniref:Uncharacterized protein n=1 Tax=Parasulfitobacter algicola TaxID=2614809 RepID=A0ABX2IKQ1_9RHOB|nr:DUF6638 family protein [Sulfitobacter algicola]NSX53433.1 hypothetical protein [Sulfitobacter algicola]
MKHLIERGLMFGNLVEVSSPVLIERYNRALRHLTGRETKLKDFHIDISGYSPEIGHELDDDLYLNHAGVNRQFILLTTEQKTAPLLDAKFSTSRGILRQFIEQNEAQLFALTARDAVAGELVNSIYDASTPARLMDIGRIRVEADTTEGTVKQAARLGKMINQFKRGDDAWFDDVLIADMITLAKKTGDVTRNPVKLKTSSFEQRSFWTSHFGGLYVFRDIQREGVISTGDINELGNIPIENVFSLSSRNQIAAFLEANDLVEPIIDARGIDAAAILRQKMDFVLVDVAATMEEQVTALTRPALRQFARRYISLLPEEFHGLAALLRWAEDNGAWPRITSDHPAYFYTLRSKPHADRDLVNMLLSELSPLDIRQLFICHKELFYKSYAGWSEQKKKFVAEFLDREYQVDKVAAREALFGHEDKMEEPSAEDIIQMVGPWGAVRRT